ncbi:tripartite tricarboxylate transporter TctB family protein [Maritimibacter alkaliphilus]|uniref:tripartite tricarboxylate transporter TctB family protein n=1 Tax=Maritimibacter alkaliphilus TaxID=404236 RepID=UPI001C96FCE2|nr:tripartite tricarboxylate transporter TctB family protein [Maritimibacter alkaliphilus]MBY6092671.1 tripartite tricarboxylate transporter TctB family protein [Maritimibacter alkaliphilus]
MTDSGRHSQRLRLAMAATSAVICAGAAWLALNIDSFVRGWAFAMPGTTDSSLAPATFPRLVLCLVALLAAANLVSALLRAPEPEEAAATPDSAGQTGPVTLPRVLLLCAASLAYLALLPVAGFILTSIAAIVLGGIATGYRTWVPLLCVALLLPPATWYAFRYGMKVILPQSDF